MQLNDVERIVGRLRERRVFAHVLHTGVGTAGVRVVLPDGREALWDADGAAGVEAQILRDGVLVGFVPLLSESEDFTWEQVADFIADADYGPA